MSKFNFYDIYEKFYVNPADRPGVGQQGLT